MVLPEIRVHRWDTAEAASPVGARNIPGGFAFMHIVASGCKHPDPSLPNYMTSGTLIFEETEFNLTGSVSPHLASKTTAITLHLVNSGVAIDDIRLYLVDGSALRGSVNYGLDPGFVQYAPSGALWKYNLTLSSGSVARLPNSVPSSQNVFRQDKSPALVGEDDQNSSEFVYLNLVLPLGFPLGTFGVCGSGLLRLGISFNYWSNDFILQFGEP
jgi:hypothetical protein